MTLLQLQYFFKVATSKTLTEASEKLNISQPSLSRHIKNLELELGFDVFNRVGRNMELNGNGKFLFDQVCIILNSINNINDKTNQTNLEIKVNFTASTVNVPNIIALFNKRYPEISLKITQKINVNVKEAYDFMFLYASRNKIYDKNVYEILKEKIFLAMPKNHRLANKDNIHLSDLRDEKLIGLVKGTALRDFTDCVFNELNIEHHPFIECEQATTVLSLVNAGFGLSLIPGRSWNKVLDINSIHLAEVEHPHFERYLYLKTSYGKSNSDNINIFKNFLIEYYNDPTENTNNLG